MTTLFCILGRSACGKDTLVDAICTQMQLKRVISYTTRKRRENEGNTHIFATLDDYWQAYHNCNIAADTRINSYYCWTTKEQLQECDLYIIDPNGLDVLLNNRPPNVRIVTIYITAPRDDLIKRANLRDPSNSIQNFARLQSEEEQFLLYEFHKNYDYCIHNVHFETTLEQLKTIIMCEKEKSNVF